MSFQNLNVCRSFTQAISTNLVALSAQPCSEVIISNKSGQTLYVFDNGYSTDSNAFALSSNDTFTFRGITDSSAVSAKTASGSGNICYRTQYFSGKVEAGPA